MDETLKALLFDDVRPNNLHEVKLLIDYLKKGSPNGPVLFLSLGETWDPLPPTLKSFLAEAPDYSHGYQLSMYGLPRLRQAFHKYLNDSYALKDSLAKSYTVAVTWSGTRHAMYDYGRYLITNYFEKDRPKIITVAPGYDYDKVFGSMGYENIYVSLRSEDGYMPDAKQYKRALSSSGKSLVVLSPQHNPTSTNWPVKEVKKIVRECLNKGAAVLIDDAFYGVTKEGIQPTSALKILLEELHASDSTHPWLMVRTMGKQFGTHGWAIGCMAGSESTIDELVNDFRPNEIYNYGGMLQYAMARWLEGEEHEDFVRSRNKGIFTNKRKIKDTFTSKFNFPESSVITGETTPFVLFEVPKSYQKRLNGDRDFLDELISLGIVFSEGWPSPFGSRTSSDWIRVYAGGGGETIDALLERLEEHNFNFLSEAIG